MFQDAIKHDLDLIGRPVQTQHAQLFDYPLNERYLAVVVENEVQEISCLLRDLVDRIDRGAVRRQVLHMPKDRKFRAAGIRSTSRFTKSGSRACVC